MGKVDVKRPSGHGEPFAVLKEKRGMAVESFAGPLAPRLQKHGIERIH